jgi:hypothetical protein
LSGFDTVRTQTKARFHAPQDRLDNQDLQPTSGLAVAHHQSLPPIEIEPSTSEKVRHAASAIAALLAVILIIAGMAVLTSALFSAWSLFRNPAGIEPLARYVTQLAPVLEGESSALKGMGTLVAWLFAVVMLLVLGKLASWAIAAASRLVAPVARHRD